MASATIAPVSNASGIDISKMMRGARLLITNFRMGIGNLRQIKVKTETTADPSQIRNQKKLVDSPKLDEIRSQDAKMRRYIEIKSLRYAGQEGVVIIADGMIPIVDRVILAYETIRRPALVEAFMEDYVAEYATDFAERRKALGDQFNIKDYPHPDAVRAGFVFNYHYMDIATTGTINIADPNIREREERKAAAIVIRAAEDMRDAMRSAGAEMVEALFSVLKPEAGKRKKLYDCHLEHLQEYLDTYNLKDVTDDVEYQRHIDTLKKIMGGVSIDKLRESDNLKDKIAKELDAIRVPMKALVQSSGRRFRV